MLRDLNMLLEESVDMKNLNLIAVSFLDEEEQPDWRQGIEGTHSLEPQRAHVTDDLVVVA